jgi:oligoribonuclease NrnB/cAMP/cGMP phosphodiesterase (DHH superfamily)
MEIFWNDIQRNINKLRDRINNDKNILLLTHAGCLDGQGNQMIFEKTFDKVFSVRLTPNAVDDYVKCLNVDLFDTIIIADLSTSNKEFLANDNVILIDHHESALYLHDPDKLCFVYLFACGTKLTKMILSAILRDDLKKFNDFAYLINDNDLFILEDERSIKLNSCYKRLGDEKFQEKYWNFGKITFTEEDNKAFAEERLEIQKLVDAAEYFISEDLNIGYMIFLGYNNEMVHEIMMKEKLDAFVTWNPTNGRGSIRSTNLLMKSGQMLSDMGIGGGHDAAAGFRLETAEEFQHFIDLTEKYIKDKFNSLKA